MLIANQVVFLDSFFVQVSCLFFSQMALPVSFIFYKTGIKTVLIISNNWLMVCFIFSIVNLFSISLFLCSYFITSFYFLWVLFFTSFSNFLKWILSTLIFQPALFSNMYIWSYTFSSSSALVASLKLGNAIVSLSFFQNVF